jgi:putative SOS response-associated peptidase YedK
VTDFCEWSGEQGAKQEHWFSLPAAPIFTSPASGVPRRRGNCYAFLTCEANPLSRRSIPRRCRHPAPGGLRPWLGGEAADACSLASPFPSQLMSVA